MRAVACSSFLYRAADVRNRTGFSESSRWARSPVRPATTVRVATSPREEMEAVGRGEVPVSAAWDPRIAPK